MKEIKLLQIVPSLESGGVEQGTIDVANYIAENGFISLVCSNGGRMLTMLNKKKAAHIKLPVNSKNPLVIYNNIKKIKKIIKKHKVNLVHVRSRAPAWSAYFASKNLCNLTSTFHNIYGNKNIFKKYYNKRLSKTNKIVAISQYVKDSISNIYNIDKKKITVIHRGIDIDFFDPKLNNEDLYIKFLSVYNIPSDKKIIIYPARLTQWKGQIEFLNILNLLKKEGIICYFIGDDKNKKYKIKLEKEIYKRKLHTFCKILGHLSRQDMRLMYKIADLVISAPLQPEGFGRVISEGLAMEKIVLCYNFGGSKEQISNLDDLYAVEPFNHKQFLEKIKISLALSDSKKNKIGKIARKHIDLNFSKKNMLKKYLDFYKKIVL